MPLILAPYTLGTQLPVAPAGALGGGAYVVRRRRFMAYMTACLACLAVLGC